MAKHTVRTVSYDKPGLEEVPTKHRMYISNITGLTGAEQISFIQEVESTVFDNMPTETVDYLFQENRGSNFTRLLELAFNEIENPLGYLENSDDQGLKERFEELNMRREQIKRASRNIVIKYIEANLHRLVSSEEKSAFLSKTVSYAWATGNSDVIVAVDNIVQSEIEQIVNYDFRADIVIFLRDINDDLLLSFKEEVDNGASHIKAPFLDTVVLLDQGLRISYNRRLRDMLSAHGISPEIFINRLTLLSHYTMMGYITGDNRDSEIVKFMGNIALLHLADQKGDQLSGKSKELDRKRKALVDKSRDLFITTLEYVTRIIQDPLMDNLHDFFPYYAQAFTPLEDYNPEVDRTSVFNPVSQESLQTSHYRVRLGAIDKLFYLTTGRTYPYRAKLTLRERAIEYLDSIMTYLFPYLGDETTTDFLNRTKLLKELLLKIQSYGSIGIREHGEVLHVENNEWLRKNGVYAITLFNSKDKVKSRKDLDGYFFEIELQSIDYQNKTFNPRVSLFLTSEGVLYQVVKTTIKGKRGKPDITQERLFKVEGLPRQMTSKLIFTLMHIISCIKVGSLPKDEQIRFGIEPARNLTGPTDIPPHLRVQHRGWKGKAIQELEAFCQANNIPLSALRTKQLLYPDRNITTVVAHQRGSSGGQPCEITVSEPKY